MNGLGVDLGTTCGFAWHSDKYHAVEVELINAAEKRWCSPGLRFIRFRERLEELVKAHDIEIVYFEKVMRHSSTYASHTYGGLWAMLTTTLDGMGVNYEGIGVGEAKRVFTGGGTASKQAMLDRAEEIGVPCAGDNAADALAVLITGEAKHGIIRVPTPARPAPVKRVNKIKGRRTGRQRDRDW